MMFGSLLRVSLLSLLLGSCSLVVGYLESSDEEVSVNDAAGIADANANPVDGGSEPGDASSSTAACTEVGPDGSCTFTCTTPDCEGDIICPEGRLCVVDCTGANACENVGIDCSMATSCEIRCQGADACDLSGIQCDGASCIIECVGSAACEDAPIECSADLCSVLCEGSNACNSGVCCDGVTCAPGVCTSSSGGNCECSSS